MNSRRNDTDQNSGYLCHDIIPQGPFARVLTLTRSQFNVDDIAKSFPSGVSVDVRHRNGVMTRSVSINRSVLVPLSRIHILIGDLHQRP